MLSYTPLYANVGDEDLTFGWGEGLIDDITLTSVLARQEDNGSDPVFHISVDVSATGYDLYDFDFWDKWPAHHAAKIQSYGSPTDLEGVVFYVKYQISRHDTLEWFGGDGPFDTTVVPYKCSTSYYPEGD